MAGYYKKAEIIGYKHDSNGIEHRILYRTTEQITKEGLFDLCKMLGLESWKARTTTFKVQSNKS